jgi:hypothetical protein
VRAVPEPTDRAATLPLDPASALRSAQDDRINRCLPVHFAKDMRMVASIMQSKREHVSDNNNRTTIKGQTNV